MRAPFVDDASCNLLQILLIKDLPTPPTPHYRRDQSATGKKNP